MQLRDQLAPVAAFEKGALGGAAGVAQRDAQQKAVELRLGQGIGAELVERVLGGDDEKWLGQAARLSVHTHLALFHRFKQGALHLRPGAVDFVGQQHLRKHRAGVKHELAAVAVEHRNAQQIARHEVGGELRAGVLQPQRGGQSMGQRGLAHPRQIFDEQMTAGQQAAHGEFHLWALAFDNGFELVEQTGQGWGFHERRSGRRQRTMLRGRRACPRIWGYAAGDKNHDDRLLHPCRLHSARNGGRPSRMPAAPRRH